MGSGDAGVGGVVGENGDNCTWITIKTVKKNWNKNEIVNIKKNIETVMKKTITEIKSILEGISIRLDKEEHQIRDFENKVMINIQTKS